MKKYADKIFVLYLVVVILCLFIQSPYMVEAKKKQDNKWWEDYRDSSYKNYQELKKKFEPETE